MVSNPVGIQISILQGSPTGTAVYVETQTTSTNANGLISIEIGGGTVVSGNFATINWANGTYFIETQTDPNGGTDFTITGTSQILSVPYALHANFADSIKEKEPAFNASVAKAITVSDTTNWSNKLSSYTETDPIFSASVAKSITASDTTNWNNKLSSYTETDPIFSASVANAITVSDTIKWTASIHKIGDSYGGGIVFYVDATGQHGLIAAIADQSTGIAWSNGTYRTTGAMSDGAGAGELNTAIIVASQIADNQSGSFAALICAQYSTTQNGITYGNWYLPSKYELNLLYNQQAAVGGFYSNYYWSSTETNYGNAWCQHFYDGSQDVNFKTDAGDVRAVRAF